MASFFWEDVGRARQSQGASPCRKTPAKPDQVPLHQLNPAAATRKASRSPDKRRRMTTRLIVLGVLLPLLHWGLGSTLAASPTARVSVLRADERAPLLQYAQDTWRAFDRW